MPNQTSPYKLVPLHPKQNRPAFNDPSQGTPLEDRPVKLQSQTDSSGHVCKKMIPYQWLKGRILKKALYATSRIYAQSITISSIGLLLRALGSEFRGIFKLYYCHVQATPLRYNTVVITSLDSTVLMARLRRWRWGWNRRWRGVCGPVSQAGSQKW